MAQNVVGGKNINLLLPCGQFGSRMSGAAIIGSSRYTETRLAPVVPFIFNHLDANILRYNAFHGVSGEPEFFAPIIPMVLVNGTKTIGSGISSNIPQYNPLDLIDNLKRLLEGLAPSTMLPWYHNFRGTIAEHEPGKFICAGNVEKLGESKVAITEIPFGTSIDKYKSTILAPMTTGTSSMLRSVIKFTEEHTDRTVRFVVSMVPGKFRQLEAEAGAFHAHFQLTEWLSTHNMWCFDENNVLQKYATADEILKEYFKIRLKLYEQRIEYLALKLAAELERLSQQLRYAEALANKDFNPHYYENAKELAKALSLQGYSENYPVLDLERRNRAVKPFGYLIDLPAESFSVSGRRVMEVQIKEKQDALAKHRDSHPTATALWQADLAILEEKLIAARVTEASQTELADDCCSICHD